MKKIYYYLTKHCFLTAFIGASIIWSFLSYNSFYERFNKIELLNYSIENTIFDICSQKTDFESKSKELENRLEVLKDFHITVSNKKYGKLYESSNYKPKWYMHTSVMGGGFRASVNAEDSENYEYEAEYQYKYILPMALLRVWTFSIIPNIHNYRYYITTANKWILRTFIKIHSLQSLYFWIMFFVFYQLLKFYRKELNLMPEQKDEKENFNS